MPKKINCDGFEFLMYNSWYEDWEQIAEYLAKTEVEFPVFHIEKQVGELISRNEAGDIEQAHKLFEINCKMAKKLGAERLVLHLWGGLPSDRNIHINIEQFAILKETAAHILTLRLPLIRSLPSLAYLREQIRN